MLATTALVLGLLLAQNEPVESPSAPPPPEGFSPPAAAVPSPDSLQADLSAEDVDPDSVVLDPLEYSQHERHELFQGGLALNLGPVMPWANYGGSVLFKKAGVIQSFSIGAGDFEFSDNYRARNYLVKTDSQSAYYAARWFFFGPLYAEPFAGLVHWNGSIKPRGYDDTKDSLSSSLNSRFDITGISAGGNLGLMWIFSNGLFLDYNLFSINASTFVQDDFTTNTNAAKKNVRKQLGGPLTMSNLQLRIGYSLAI